MHRFIRASILFSASVLVVPGCATQGSEGAAPKGDGSTDPQTATEAAAAAQGPRAPSTQLQASAPPTAMHEVFLDPTATAALTVDWGGATHLWPQLLTDQAVSPYELPIFEPQFLSLGRDDRGTFRLASIDASGATVMASVVVDGDTATYTEVLRLPPHDSALEVHVLADGRRALWLGLDHSIRLYDLTEPTLVPAEAERARIERTAFVPWQLRVTHGVDGTEDHAVAIVAGPTRALPLTIGETSLETGAETPALPLDRGPNRNDLALTPDGKRLVTLRRPTAKTKEVHLYVHELGADGIRLLGGEVDVRWRGRMLLTGPTSALIETGLGRGFEFDLSKAVPLETVKVVTKRRKQRPAPVLEPSTEHLLSRTSPPPDRDFEFDLERYAGRRVHVDFRAGVRAVPEGDALIIDPLDSDTHFVHGTTRLEGRAVAFAADGETLAVATETELMVLDRDTMTVRGRRNVTGIRALAFVDDDHVACYGKSETLEVFSIQGLGDKPTESLEVPVKWVLARSVFVSNDQGLTLYVRGDRPSDPIYRVVFDGTSPGAVKRLGRDAADRARPLLEENDAIDRAGNRYSVERRELTYPRWSGDHDDHRVLVQTSSDGKTIETPLRRGIDAEIVPDPTGKRIAVRQGTTLSVYDTKDLTRAWTRAASAHGLSWSTDGSELAIIGSAGVRVYAADDGQERALETRGAPRHEQRRDGTY